MEPTLFFENWQTGKILKITKSQFDAMFYNPRQWDEITEARYNELRAMKS